MEREQEPRLTFLDTHILIWLCTEKRRRFPQPARAAIESGWLAISPMVELELEFLREIGRIRQGASAILNALATLPLHIDPTPFASVARAAATQPWTRDPFDRFIVGQAIAAGGCLVTADERIQQHFPNAIWA
ncbi:MAG: type II toxin-antitoxin system VapC family toxin [Azonexus sp.]